MQGVAARDDDFVGGRDRVRYVVEIPGDAGPPSIEIVLRFQPIAFRWARNLQTYAAPETKRFVTFFDSMASVSSDQLARATATVR